MVTRRGCLAATLLMAGSTICDGFAVPKQTSPGLFPQIHTSSFARKNAIYLSAARSEDSSYDRPHSLSRRHQKRKSKKPFRRRKHDIHLAALQHSTHHVLQQHQPEPSTLIALIHQWSAFRKTEAQVPLRIEDLIKALVDRQYPLDISIYNTLIDAWACAALFHTHPTPINAAQRATEILRTLQKEASTPLLLPNESSFSTVLHVVCRVQGPVHARRLLGWLEMLYDTGKNTAAQPTRKHYITILDAYFRAYRGDRRAALIEGCIAHIQYRGTHHDAQLLGLPDTKSFNLATKAWCEERKKGLPGRQVAEHADRILDMMKKDATGLCRPDVITYSTVISAWAASEMKSHAVSRVEHLLREIEDSDNVDVNTVVLNAVMSTWVKSKKAAAVDRTAELIETMELSHAASNIQPDQVSYNTHLHALSLHANPWRPELVDRAYAVLNGMEQKQDAGLMRAKPNTFTYNLVMEIVYRTRSTDCSARAAALLQRMTQRPGVEPDSFSFNKVLSALSISGDHDAAEKAEELLRYMDTSYKAGSLRRARPDAASFTSVIHAYAQSDASTASQAQKLFDEMKQRAAGGEDHLRPTRVCYNAMIDCWGKSGEGTYGARQAEFLLQEMMDAGDLSIAPDLTTFNAILNAWAKSGTRCCGNQAEKYLKRMWSQYNAGDTRVKPNRISYNTVINAISKSQCDSKAQRALRMLRKMDLLYQAGNREARPNHISYTAVLNSCAFTSGPDPRIRRKALYVARFTLKELQDSCYGRPNEITYATFIKACSNLLHDDDVLRRETIRTAFQQCATDGQVGRLVLSSMPDDLLYEELMGMSEAATDISLDDLPPAWKCNVDTKRKYVAVK